MTDETKMVAAHKAGRAFVMARAHSIEGAEFVARMSYETQDEQDAFVAGYLGELKREATR
jgi:hypothetical protein